MAISLSSVTLVSPGEAVRNIGRARNRTMAASSFGYTLHLGSTRTLADGAPVFRKQIVDVLPTRRPYGGGEFLFLRHQSHQHLGQGLASNESQIQGIDSVL